MRRIYLMISVIIIGLGSVLLLNWVMQTPTVLAQADPNVPAAPNTVYLPLVSLSVPVPTPTPSSRIKEHSGIHMGNRGIGSDWNDQFFQRLRGTAAGKWPRQP